MCDDGEGKYFRLVVHTGQGSELVQWLVHVLQMVLMQVMQVQAQN